MFRTTLALIWALTLVPAPALAQTPAAPPPADVQQTPQQAVHHIFTRAAPHHVECPVKLPVGSDKTRWSDAEKWAWDQICLGRWANMSQVDAPSNRSNKRRCRPRTAKQMLSASFLELILSRAPWANATMAPDVRISCARVPELLDLAHQGIPARVAIVNSRFESGIDLSGARFERSLDLDGNTVRKGLNAPGLKVTDDLYLRDGHYGPDPALTSDSKSCRPVKNPVSAIVLDAARIGNDLEISGSTLTSDLKATDLQVGGDFLLREGGNYQKICLYEIKVSGNLNLGKSKFNDSLILRWAHIEQDLLAIGARFKALKDEYGRPKMSFDATSVNVKGVVMLRSGHFTGVNMRHARLGRLVQLSGSFFAGDVNLSSTVMGELEMFRIGTRAYNDRSKVEPDPIWDIGSKLILRNAHATALQARPSSWKDTGGEWIHADLNGMVYNRLGGLRSGLSTTMIDLSSDELVRWLQCIREGAQVSKNCEQPDELKRYEPSPYQHLEKILRQEGMDAKAKAVRFAKFEHRSDAPPEGTSCLNRCLFWPLSKVLVGYGVYPFIALGWFLALVGLGILVGAVSRTTRGLTGLSDWVWYSVENAMPLVELTERHKKVRHGNRWVDGFYHMQKLLGFALATYLVGALTLLAE